MLKKRILASSMASVMALTAICSVANAERPYQDPENPGYDNEAFAKKSKAELQEYTECDYIKEKLEASDYGATRTANFMKAYNYAQYVLANGTYDDDDDEYTVAYRELAAAAGRMTHTDLEDLKKLKAEKEAQIEGGNHLKGGLEYDLNWTDASFTQQRKAVDEAQDVIEYRSDDRAAIDEAYDNLEKCNLVKMDTVDDETFHKVVKQCYDLLGQRNKYDAWTRIEVKNSYAGFNGVYSYGYYMWAMEKIYNELNKSFTEFNGHAIKLTSNVRYVNCWKDFRTLYECLNSCVNEGKPYSKYDKYAYRDTASEGNVDELINKVYHNRLAFNYTTTGITGTTAWSALAAASDEDDGTQPLLKIPALGTADDKTFNSTNNTYTDGAETKALLASLKAYLNTDTTNLKLWYNSKAANYDSNNRKAAENWVEVTSSTKLMEMWSLNWGNDGKLGAAELELKVTFGTGNQSGGLVALKNNKTGKYVAFASKGYSDNNKTGKNSEYEWVDIQYGAPFNLSDKIDVMQAIIVGIDSGSFGGGNGNDLGAPGNLTETTATGTGTILTGSRNTNVGNGVVDGAASDTDGFIGFVGLKNDGANYSVNNPFLSLNPSASTILNLGTAAADNAAVASTTINTNDQHGVNWSGEHDDLYSTVDADKAIELAGLYLNGFYTDRQHENDSTNTLSDKNDKTPLIVKVSNGASTPDIYNQIAYLDASIDTNGDFITRKYKLLATADSSSVPEYTYGENNGTQWEWANVYNYVNYALQDVYGDTKADVTSSNKGHDRYEVNDLVNGNYKNSDGESINMRKLLDLTKSVKIFSTEWDAAYRAANDADKWFGKTLTNKSWKDNTDYQDISGAQIDNPEYFNADNHDAYNGVIPGGDMCNTGTSDGKANLNTTATGFMNSDELYHGVEKVYNELWDLYKKFRVTYGEIADDIIACELDYKNNPSDDYKKAIMRCALALSNVEAPKSGRYVGPDFEAFDVNRKFYPENRVNNVTDSGNPNKQSDSQAELLAAWDAMLAAKNGDVTEDPIVIECKLRGDANDDGSVKAADATVILRHLVVADDSDEKLVEGTDKYKNAAAADGKDGITSADAAAILKYLVSEKWD